MATINIEAVAVPNTTRGGLTNGYKACVFIAGEQIISDHLTCDTEAEAEKRAEWLFAYALTEMLRNQ